MLEFIIGFGSILLLIGIFAIVSLFISDKGDIEKDYYDERQIKYRLISMKKSFFVFLFLTIIYLIMTQVFKIEIFAKDISGVFFLAISSIVFTCETIWYDAYDSFKYNTKKMSVLDIINIVISVIFLMLIIFNMNNGVFLSQFFKNNLIQLQSIIFYIPINSIAMLITRLIKSIKNKKDEI